MKSGINNEIVAAPLADVTGFVLAGGASSRMGEDKTKLRLGGGAMLDPQVSVLRIVCRSVAVVERADSYGLGVPALPMNSLAAALWAVFTLA